MRASSGAPSVVQLAPVCVDAGGRGAGAAAEPMLRAAARSPSLAALGLEGHTAGRSAHCPA